MIVYRFLSESRALEALRDRRLKLSLINELNDPFEFMAIDVGDKRVRRSFAKVKAIQSRTTGLLCFSTKWSNPLLWSHYADRHRGICLGFDVARELVQPVDYAKERIVTEEDWLRAPESEKMAVMQKSFSPSLTIGRTRPRFACSRGLSVRLQMLCDSRAAFVNGGSGSVAV
jgi:hypothetical protein